MRVYKLIDAKYGLLALQSRRLKVATIKDLNDPFEFMAVKMDDAYNRRAFAYFREEAHRTWGMLCFSQGWSDPVLWSHYGDKHRGMALGFDIPDEYATPVTYSPDRVICRRTADGFPIEAIAQNHVTKFKHWAYEQEVRMFVGLDESTNEDGLYFYDFAHDLVLKEIVLGPESSLTREDVIHAVGRRNGGLLLSKARLAFTCFSVVTQKQFKVRKI